MCMCVFSFVCFYVLGVIYELWSHQKGGVGGEREGSECDGAEGEYDHAPGGVSHENLIK